MKQTMTIALAGNPNAGKTTIFNALTGSRQHVGNYPGVTVEHKEGFCKHKDFELKIVDLPGTYSLTAFSAEELVARNFILDEKPDVVVSVVDSSNLERNLYLSIQLMELGIPLVMAFNMFDMAKDKGIEFDLAKLEKSFGAKIIPTVGHRNEGIDNLLDTLANIGLSNKDENPRPLPNPLKIEYGADLEAEIEKLSQLIAINEPEMKKYPARWLSIKLLENDRELINSLQSQKTVDAANESIKSIESRLDEMSDTIIAAKRYELISRICSEAVKSGVEFHDSFTDKLDSVLINRYLGVPIFLAMMFFVFQLTFTLGEAPMGWIEGFFGWLATYIGGLWPEGSESLLKSLLIDGIIGGVGGVIIFLPNIFLLFLAISLLEDSGYMARVAFIMDRLMQKIGLHGKSFIPMLIGFGCSVPAIMGTRTLENYRDRLVTIMVIPLMSCGARFPIYALFIPAFFPAAWHAPVLWFIYLTGIILAIVCAKIFRVTMMKGETIPFVMELPPYRIPTITAVLLHMWERGWLYLKKAGTLILAISILLWVLTTFPQPASENKARFETMKTEITNLSITKEEKAQRLEIVENQQSEEALKGSYAGKIGMAMEPVLRPMGFDWRIGTALIGAFAAKEVFVAQMGIVMSVGAADEESESLKEKLKAAYSPLIGLCVMLFCLISAPCMATIAVTKRETNSWFWASFQLAWLTIMAWVLTTVVYQIGSYFQIGI
ncbi:MAG: ferrous iron transport protein B [Clostridia bacterium]|nr:ferrous iron transport protein B [Clostridia bacterium]